MFGLRLCGRPFPPFTLGLPVSFELESVFPRQLLFCSHSFSGSVSLDWTSHRFTLRVITDQYIFTATWLMVFLRFCHSLSSFLGCLPLWLDGVLCGERTPRPWSAVGLLPVCAGGDRDAHVSEPRFIHVG